LVESGHHTHRELLHGWNMKYIDNILLDTLTQKAIDSPRKRMNYNLHTSLHDPLQRLCNAIEQETYIRPHRHADPETLEIFLLLRGAAVILLFETSGKVAEKVILAEHGPLKVVEIPSRTWHTIASLESGTVFFEVKKGPYIPQPEAHLAPWSPKEGSPATTRFVAWFKNAQIGDMPPA